MMSDSISKSAVQDKHSTIIENLANESDQPVEQIQELYRIECAQLELVARITTYVPVLASRRVRIRLRESGNNKKSSYHS